MRTESRFRIESNRVLADQRFNSLDDRIEKRFQDINPGMMKKGWIAVKSSWLETPFIQGWIAAFRLLIQNGRPVIAELRLFPDEKLQHRCSGEWSASMLGNDATAPQGGITMPTIRRLKLGIVRTEIKTILDEFRAKAPWVLERFQLNVQQPKKRIKKKSEKRGRPSTPDVHLARLAKHYAECCYSGSSSPIADTASRFKIKVSIARTRLHEARRRGLLTASGQKGVAWGQLTDKATAILQRKKGA